MGADTSVCGGVGAGMGPGIGMGLCRGHGYGHAACRSIWPQAQGGAGHSLWNTEHRIDFPHFWVKEVGQTGPMARHNTQNGQQCCDRRSPFKSTVHNGNNVPSSTMSTQIARRRRRGISVPRAPASAKGVGTGLDRHGRAHARTCGHPHGHGRGHVRGRVLWPRSRWHGPRAPRIARVGIPLDQLAVPGLGHDAPRPALDEERLEGGHAPGAGDGLGGVDLELHGDARVVERRVRQEEVADLPEGVVLGPDDEGQDLGDEGAVDAGQPRERAGDAVAEPLQEDVRDLELRAQGTGVSEERRGGGASYGCQHTNYWAPRTRKRHQQEHRPQRPTESSDPTQHAEGRTGDRPGPRKETTTRRNVTQGWGGGVLRLSGIPIHPLAQALGVGRSMGTDMRQRTIGCRAVRGGMTRISRTREQGKATHGQGQGRRSMCHRLAPADSPKRQAASHRGGSLLRSVAQLHKHHASALTATELTNSPNQDFGVGKTGGNGGKWREMEENGGKWREMGRLCLCLLVLMSRQLQKAVVCPPLWCSHSQCVPTYVLTH